MWNDSNIVSENQANNAISIPIDFYKQIINQNI